MESLRRAPARAPQPEHAAAHTNKGSMFLFLVAPALPSPLPPPPGPIPAALCARDFISDSSRPGTAWVRKDLRRLENWVGDGARIVPSCCQPQSPTGSRRRVADVREDKGRHGPHQPPPAMDGLCQPWLSFSLTFTLHPPTSSPQPPASGPGGRGSGGDGVCSSTCTLLFTVFYFSKVGRFEVSSLSENARDGITQSAPRGPPD